ncbi:IS30 family transposase [Actinotalea subterranea]|uniref:IS30 family transposase n=1 Tax=Actinotalea subterranea TaxID=2607497 RepID=UPI003CCC7E85
MARGWTAAAARREVGVSRSTSRNWRNGFKVYRDGEVVGFVPPIDRLAASPISPRFLSQHERIEIADLHRAGQSVRAIAAAVGRSPSTVSRELRRNGRRDGQYRPFEAHHKAAMRRRRPRRPRWLTTPALESFLLEHLRQRWSPQQISRELGLRFPGDAAMSLCPESIYQAIYRPGSPLTRPPIARHPARSPLRTGRDHRRAHRRLEQRRHRFTTPGLTVHDRPFDPTDRTVPGAWEGDLIVGPGHRSAIGTLVERQTRFVRLIHLPRQDSRALADALIDDLASLPTRLRSSITWDQGTEMSRHQEITHALGTRIYFCDAHSPWQRGSNENTNGLLRQYFPKGTDLSRHTPTDLQAVADELNARPRAVLDHRPPAVLFSALLASPNHLPLR